MSALTWCGPSSRSTSFIALKIGRSGQPVQKPGGRPCTTSASGANAVVDPGVAVASGAPSTPEETTGGPAVLAPGSAVVPDPLLPAIGAIGITFGVRTGAGIGST